jgi:hypothetical protein
MNQDQTALTCDRNPGKLNATKQGLQHGGIRSPQQKNKVRLSHLNQLFTNHQQQ